MELIDKDAFWDWMKKDEEFGAHYNEVRRRWGDAIDQKIKEINWQLTKIRQHAQKVENILKTDIGRALLGYMREIDPDIAAIIKRR